MSDFWKSVQTIQADYGSAYRSFSLFDKTHWGEPVPVCCGIAA